MSMDLSLVEAYSDDRAPFTRNRSGSMAGHGVHAAASSGKPIVVPGFVDILPALKEGDSYGAA